jgi:DNA repair exonuclease SbcCD ATPase subunit
LATDAQRKALLEELLGLERYAAAHTEARKANRELSDRISRLTAEVTSLRSNLLAQQQVVENATKTLNSLGVEGTSDEDVEAWSRVLEMYEDDLDAVRSGIAAVQRTISGSLYKVKGLEDRLSRLQHDECPSCGQYISQSMQAAARKELVRARKQSSEVVRGARENLVALQAEHAELDTDNKLLRDKIAAAQAVERMRQKTECTRGVLSRQIADAQALVFSSAEQIDTLLRALEEAEVDRGVSDLAVDVLGLRGVRAVLLMRALGALQTSANRWLSRFVGRFASMTLSAYEETKTAGVRGSIGMSFAGVGKGKTYKALSAGERRRVDTAMTFALAEVAAAVSGSAPGTLFFDEALDSPLDDEGVEAVSLALREVAQTRCVVVITHRTDAEYMLRPAVRYELGSGIVQKIQPGTKECTI